MRSPAKVEIEIEVRNVHQWNDYERGDKYLENSLKQDVEDVLSRNLGIDRNDCNVKVKVARQ